MTNSVLYREGGEGVEEGEGGREGGRGEREGEGGERGEREGREGGREIEGREGRENEREGLGNEKIAVSIGESRRTMTDE